MTCTSAPTAHACWINPPAPSTSSSGCGATTMIRSSGVMGGNAFWARTRAWAIKIRNTMTALRRISPADALVHESQLVHLLRVEQVAAIEHERVGHHGAQLFEVKLAEFVPLRANDERVRPRGDRIRVFTKLDTR